jgi:hypothetical protein
MYWRHALGDHLPAGDATTITVMKAVSSTNHTDMPSTPRW